MSTCGIDSVARQGRGLSPVPQDHQNAIKQLKAEVEALHIAEYLRRHPPVYDVNQFLGSVPTRHCNQTIVDEWRKHGATAALSETAQERLRFNQLNNWSEHAFRALEAAVKAFALVQIPLIMTDGTSLGWYRQCGIIEHTNDIDVSVPVDYIVSMRHLHLLQV